MLFFLIGVLKKYVAFASPMSNGLPKEKSTEQKEEAVKK